MTNPDSNPQEDRGLTDKSKYEYWLQVFQKLKLNPGHQVLSESGEPHRAIIEQLRNLLSAFIMRVESGLTKISTEELESIIETIENKITESEITEEEKIEYGWNQVWDESKKRLRQAVS